MMSEGARAAVIVGPQRIEVRTVELPEPGPGDLLVEVEACGICGSNLHEWRHPDQRLTVGDPPPGAAGHEVAVRVVTAPPNSTWRRGDRAVLEPNRVSSCGVCTACTEGRDWFCRSRRPVGSWGFATQMVVPERSLFAAPEGLPGALATLVEPAACVVHALRHSWTASDAGLDGRSIVILGAGVTGLLAIPIARHLGMGEIAITARHAHQADAATRLGADRVLDAEDTDLVGHLVECRADLVLEAVGGAAPTFELACRVVRPRGEVVVLGLFDAPVSIDARRAVFRELRTFFPVTYGVRDGRHDFEVAIEALEHVGRSLESLVTHRFGLGDVATAFETAASKRDAALRVTVVPGEDRDP